MTNTANTLDYASETNLWVAVIDKAIKDATREVGRGSWDAEWQKVEGEFRSRWRDDARAFFSNGSCTDILEAMDVNADWFYRKLGEKHPGIFEE